MKLKKIRLVVCFICLVAVLFIAARCIYGDKKPDYRIEIVEIAPGNYGYKIKQYHKVVIYQPFVPAIANKKSFTTESDALKVATLVVERITTGNDFSITLHDLEKLGIVVSE